LLSAQLTHVVIGNLSFIALCNVVPQQVRVSRAGNSVAHHLMGSYQRSLLAIMLAQFTRKRFAGGMSGVVRLAKRSVTVQVSPNLALLVSHCSGEVWVAWPALSENDVIANFAIHTAIQLNSVRRAGHPSASDA